jgi:hypothetical protein
MDCTNPDCGENTIVSEMTPQGIRRYCNVCKVALAATPKPVPVIAVPVPVAQPLKRASEPAAKLTPKTLLRDARARVAELNREIKRMKSLVKERDALKRLLSAAKKQPLDGGAVVRPLRKQG